MMKSYAPKTMAELPASLAALTPESKIVGGGTDFVIRLHSGAVQPDALCYLGHIPELKKIEKQGDTISVGAYCTMTQMEHDPIVREYLPALMDAAADVGSLQIRNNGTIGGNLGNASPAGDLHPVMYLYDAKVEIASPNGTRIRTGDRCDPASRQDHPGSQRGLYPLPVPRSRLQERPL